MKRHPMLLKLSREHHSALQLALHARRAAETGDVATMQAMAQRIISTHASELEPHFCEEEQDLLPTLASADVENGQPALVARTLADHAELRAMVGAMDNVDADLLRRFGELLATHVRFEERELFEQLQAMLGN